MPSRSSSFTIPGYLFIGLAGVLFIMVPPSSVSAFYIHNNIWFIEVFGIFYALGGFTALCATISRKWLRSNVIPTYHFERAGLFLIISATSIYIYSLFQRGFQTGDINTLALACLFAGILFMKITRLRETIIRTRPKIDIERKKDAD